MNIYEVLHMDGRFQSVEADFFERQSDDWAFFTGETEVFRVDQLDVLSACQALPCHAPRAADKPLPLARPHSLQWARLQVVSLRSLSFSR